MRITRSQPGSISVGFPTRHATVGAHPRRMIGSTGNAAVPDSCAAVPTGRVPSLDLRWNAPNAITLVRGLGAVLVGMWAYAESSATLLVIAYAVYWIGDSLDGQVARRTGQETRFGAVLDILTDRLSTAIVCLGLLQHLPELWPAVTVFLVNFMVVDCLLSMAFLMWPLTSPNYFGSVDRRVYLLNWSHPAKATNNAGIVAVVLVGNVWYALGFAAAMLALKLWSAREVSRLLRARQRTAP